MIRILWPTIRPKQAKVRFLEWEALSYDPLNINVHWGLNSDAGRGEINSVPSVSTRNECVSGFFDVYPDARPGVSHTATLLTHGLLGLISDYDVTVLASDDYSVPLGWDSYLYEQFKDFDGMLIANDHKSYTTKTNIVPIPICSGKFLKRLNGILYHPDYSHFFSDQELYDIVMEIGNVKDRRGTTDPRFEHKHWTFGGRQKDEFDLRNNTWWVKDKQTYERRKSLSLDQKLQWNESCG